MPGTGERFRTFALAVGFLMQICDHSSISSNALRMINLDAPQMALEGDTIQLSCSYSLVTHPVRAHSLGEQRSAASNVGERPLEIETVYVVKWYRDENEFFRYLTRDWPHKQPFVVDGLDIDVEKSDNQTVVLRNVSLKTSGLFRCEVSTDAPSFLTESIERRLLIHHLPSEGPFVEHLNPARGRQQYLGVQLNFFCRSRESKPAAQIDWIVNETVNLTAINNLPADSSGKPLIQMQTRRIVRIPSGQTLGRAFRSTPHFEPEVRKGGSFVYLVENQLSLPQSSALGRASMTAYTVEDPDALAAGHLGENWIPLESDSLNYLLESSVSWLNLTVDGNLLQYLSSVGAPPDKSDHTDVTWATRKSVGASTNSLNSLNRTSRGNALAKTRGRVGMGIGSYERDASYPKRNGSRLILRVRCVARVVHLSLSGDVRLHLINKTRQNDSEMANPSTRFHHASGLSDSGAKHTATFSMHVILLSVLAVFIGLSTYIDVYP